MSVTQKRSPVSGQGPAPSRPGPTKTGYSPEALLAQSIRVPSGSSASAWIDGNARATVPRSPAGTIASASSS